MIYVRGLRKYNALVVFAMDEPKPEITLVYVSPRATTMRAIREVPRVPHRETRQNALDAYWDWPGEQK